MKYVVRVIRRCHSQGDEKPFSNILSVTGGILSPTVSCYFVYWKRTSFKRIRRQDTNWEKIVLAKDTSDKGQLF